jgi:hypothetical protein
MLRDAAQRIRIPELANEGCLNAQAVQFMQRAEALCERLERGVASDVK